eukprot:Sdes_comp19306_c1_seq1m10421
MNSSPMQTFETENFYSEDSMQNIPSGFFSSENSSEAGSPSDSTSSDEENSIAIPLELFRSHVQQRINRTEDVDGENSTDIQGISWHEYIFSREEYRASRLSGYHSYANITDYTREEVQKEINSHLQKTCLGELHSEQLSPSGLGQNS